MIKITKVKFFYLEFEDEDGNKQYFTEDVILNHEGQEYAVLVHVQDEEHEGQDDTYMNFWLASKQTMKAKRNMFH